MANEQENPYSITKRMYFKQESLTRSMSIECDRIPVEYDLFLSEQEGVLSSYIKDQRLYITFDYNFVKEYDFRHDGPMSGFPSPYLDMLKNVMTHYISAKQRGVNLKDFHVQYRPKKK